MISVLEWIPTLFSQKFVGNVVRVTLSQVEDVLRRFSFGGNDWPIAMTKFARYAIGRIRLSQFLVLISWKCQFGGIIQLNAILDCVA